jgi:hypothetical protein
MIEGRRGEGGEDEEGRGRRRRRRRRRGRPRVQCCKRRIFAFINRSPGRYGIASDIVEPLEWGGDARR